ncbi:hypothetical protein DFH06DRAFT_605995 [Mycena polygramma]|nr:hypothetical protein DFH06DRAFT_605995 [Mycena polygramma]
MACLPFFLLYHCSPCLRLCLPCQRVSGSLGCATCTSRKFRCPDQDAFLFPTPRMFITRLDLLLDPFFALGGHAEGSLLLLPLIHLVPFPTLFRSYIVCVPRHDHCSVSSLWTCPLYSQVSINLLYRPSQDPSASLPRASPASHPLLYTLQHSNTTAAHARDIRYARGTPAEEWL